ncbi:MAG TPA: hypothetical protein VKQ28_14245 [Candidatus Acidoferrum sp.]|nr:hypothetical protein [Candidatus Acidoferrum sp.]
MCTLFYDIFKRDENGGQAWVETVADLESAKSRIIQLCAEVPGQYVVFSERGRVVGSGTIVTSQTKSSHDHKSAEVAQKVASDKQEKRW